MKNFKSFKWGYGIVVSLVLGLSGCYMDGRNPQNVDYSAHQTMKQNTGATTGKAKTATKSYASKDPVQKSTPGPKQTAAPQLPVIQ
ncbi:hypothetical protein [Legionella maioricensis]|uniref:Lipoprotein n=1 Tax=Legionella maioricensis TaxID=2896528 RepID=A0A9X2CY87_9GAMM|nr:hypothetical protein [Legionella maioricensis]MCL9683065.1 hypothetical protein [Legionella maioricensis]MCL9686413.1 hypothetical protein [Legionella maioricensis]